jgi:lipoprotein signal peptidase
MLYAIIAVLVILADQLIKIYVTADGFQPMTLIPGVLNMGVPSEGGLNYVQNTGGAFGIFGGSIPTFWFIVIAGVFTLLVILALSTKFIKGFLARWSIVLVTAGGISNCIDRVINVKPDGHVVDMFQFEFAKTWFPVFNLADVFITVFCIVFIFAILFGRGDKRSDDEEDEFTEDEEEEEEEDVEERPRRGRKSRKADLDEDYEEEELPPAKPERKSRKARQSRYDEEYEQYKAAQRQRADADMTEAAPFMKTPAPAYEPADPFAEWERANQAQQPAPAPAPAPVQPAQPEPAPQLIRSAPRQRPAAARSDLAADPQYASRPAAPAQPEQPAPAPAPAPAPRPARKPAPAPVEEPESFSLDDILAEFK